MTEHEELKIRYNNLLRSYNDQQTTQYSWICNGILIMVIGTTALLIIKGGQHFGEGIAVGVILTLGFMLGLLGSASRK